MKKFLVLGLCCSVTAVALAASPTSLTRSQGKEFTPVLTPSLARSIVAAPVVQTQKVQPAAVALPSLSASMAADLSPEALEIQALKNAGQPIPQYLYDIVNAQNGVQSRLVVPEDGSRQGGDTIASATVIGSLPYSDTGTTVGYVNDYDSVCPYSGSTSGDVVYSYAPGSNQSINIDLCNSAYDTKVYVFENTAGNVIACNDDFYFGAPCFTYSSAIEGVVLTSGNTYYIVVDGYAGSNGAYQLDVTSAACDPIVCVGTDENEAGGNDGPNEDPVLFGSIDCAETVCGTVATFGDTLRDLDWFELLVGGAGGIVTVDLNVESFNGILFFLDTDAATILYSADVNGFCEDESLVTECLPAGIYYVVAGPNAFAGVDTPANYALSVSCEACTFLDPCDAFEAAMTTIPSFPYGGTGSTVGGPDIFGINNGAVGYEFTLTETSSVTFSACQPGSDFDIDTYLYDANGPCGGGAQLFYNDGNSGCTYAAWASEWSMDCTLGAGTYVLVVTGYNYGTPTEGNFEFIMDAASCACPPINCVGTDENEAGGNDGPNEDPVLFGEIACGETVCGTVATFGDTLRDLDWFELIVGGSGGIVTATLNVESFNGILFFLDSDAATIIASADLGGFCADETLTTACLPAGVYYVVAGPNAFSGVDTPANYGLTVTCEACTYSSPCDGAVAIACGGSYAGDTTGDLNVIGNPAPDNFFIFNNPITQLVTFSTCGGATWDTWLRLFDGCPTDGATQLASNDDFCGLQSTISSVLAAGTYYVVLEGFSSSFGAYTMSVTCEPYVPPVYGTCQVAAVDGEDWTLATSEADVVGTNYLRAERFGSVVGTITAVDFNGSPLYNSPSWANCAEDPIPFTITFYDTAMNVVVSYTPSLSGVISELFAGVYQTYDYHFDLPTPLALAEGFFSAQGGGSNTCWFLWTSSPTGTDGTSQLSTNGVWAADTFDLNYCLTSGAAPCDAVADLTITKSGPNVVLNWTAAAGATAYNVYESVDAYTLGALVATVPATTTTFTIVGPKKFYIVKSVCP